jgi:hypothetical protein
MRKHCTMGELLALRDGEGTTWARAHVDECPSCRHELELVHGRVAALRALPGVRPPRDRWAVVKAQAESERLAGRLRRLGWGVMAVAASVALVIGVRAVGMRQTAPGPVAAGVQGTETRDLADLVSQSQQLEATLREYGTEGRVLNAGAASVIAELEDRIAVVDAGIAQASARGEPPRQLVGLWRDRVQLMDALVNAHVTRVAYVGF